MTENTDPFVSDTPTTPIGKEAYELRRIDAMGAVVEAAWNLREWLRECARRPILRPVLDSLVSSVRARLSGELCDADLAEWASQLPSNGVTAESLLAALGKLFCFRLPEGAPIPELKWPTLSRHRARMVAARLCDEKGELLFDPNDDADVDAVERMEGSLLQHIWELGEALDAGGDRSGQDLDASDSTDEPTVAEDFRSLHWDGTTYEFTPTQAAWVRVLWEHWKQRTATVGEQSVLESAESNSGRLRDVFKNHPAWGTLIVPSKKGAFKLERPTEKKG